MTLIETRNSPYPADHIEQGLMALALHGDHSMRASEATGIPASTLRTWRQHHAERYQEIRRDLAPQVEQAIVQDARAYVLSAGEVERAALQATLDGIHAGTIKDPSTALRNVSVSKAVNIDKVLQLEGRPTSIVEHRTGEEVLRALEAKGYIDTTAEEEPGAHQDLHPTTFSS